MTKLNWQRRLKVLLWQNHRIVAVCSATVFAMLLYTKFFVSESGGEAELKLAIPLLLPLFGVALGFLIVVLVVLIDD